MPAMMVKYKADIHDTKPDREVNLYKELLFKGILSSGTGIFRTGIVRPTTFTLVFQGRGNVYDNLADFMRWRLDIEGKKANYAFFGKLDSGESQANIQRSSVQ